MYCKNCGKILDDDVQYCKYCGICVQETVAVNDEETSDNKANEVITPDNIKTKNVSRKKIIVTILCLLALSYAIFSPVKFEVQIMGVSAEVKISYDLIMHRAKFRVGAFGFDKDNVSVIDFLNIKLNVANHVLSGGDTSFITESINNENQKLNNSNWYNKALTEYYANEKVKKYFFINNLFKSKTEKEESFYNIVKRLEISADDITNTYSNANFVINEEYVRKHIKDFQKLGFDIDYAEGMYYFKPYYPYLLQTFGIPKAWKEYLELSYLRQSDFGEAYCKLAANDIRNVINQYDKFILKNPDFIYIEEVKKEQNSYIYSYLHGFDNGRIFDYETNRIKDEYKKSIETFLSEDTKFSRYDLVNEYYNKIKKNNYKINENISDWLWNKLF